MSKKHEQESTTKEIFETVIESTTKSEQFFEKNAKKFTYIFGGLLLVALAWFGYQKFVSEPNLKEASKKIFAADQHLKRDSLNLALNGDGANYGYLDIINEYGNTPEGEFAKIKAANILFKQDKFQEALNTLDNFSSSDNFLPALVNGMKGDCLVELKKNEEALNAFDKGINTSSNDLSTPYLLKKAGLLALSMNQKEKALAYFEKIQNEYSKTSIASDVTKFIQLAK